MSISTEFFSCTAQLWNSMVTECYPLTYDLNGFKSRVNRYLLSLGFFLISFPICFSSFCTCNSMFCSGCSTLHRVNPNFIKKIKTAKHEKFNPFL